MKKILSLLFVIPGLISCALGQDPTALKYADLITKETSYKQLSKLAGPEFQGRGTGQIGGKMAAEYIASEFQKYGLIAPVKGSNFQALALQKVSFQVSQFQVAGQDLQHGKDFYITGSQADQLQSSEVVFVGYGISDAKFNELKGLN